MDHTVRITAADLGRRVSVRRRTPSGSATDVVGDLTAITATTLVVRDRDDVSHEIARSDVVAGRVVTSRPAPPRAATLERVAAAGWPAVETAPLGDWLLRASGGFTSRANSVLAVGSPGVPFPEAADTVRDWYATRALPARAATVLPSAEDDAFAALGWAPSPAVLVQTARVADVLASVPHLGDVEIHPQPTRSWLARYTARGDVTPQGRQVLTGGGLVAFAHLGPGAPEAIGRGVVVRPSAPTGVATDAAALAPGVAPGSGLAPAPEPGPGVAPGSGPGPAPGAAPGATSDVSGWLGISAVEVAPNARRRGLAVAITQALLAWGADQGAERVYLQVQTDNRPALALYERLGFRTHHRYRYRTAR